MAYRYSFLSADETLKLAVWSKARAIANFDPYIWRHDICGSVMKYEDHGVEGKYGWEIDHIKPLAKNGSEDLSNLQPLNWENNRRKSDTYPWYG